MAKPHNPAGNAGKGRRKGSQNKFTMQVKDMILTALNEAHDGGGVEYLKAQAIANPVAFMALVGKVLPMQLVGDPDNPLQTITRIELVAPAE